MPKLMWRARLVDLAELCTIWDQNSPFEHSSTWPAASAAPLQVDPIPDTRCTDSQDDPSHSRSPPIQQPSAETPDGGSHDRDWPFSYSEMPSSVSGDVLDQYQIASQSTPPRQLPRRRSRYRTFEVNGRRTALMDPGSELLPYGGLDASDPLQRWRNSPPEQEPASFSAISQAVQRHTTASQTSSRRPQRSRGGRVRSSGRRAGSTSSVDSATSGSSAQSESSVRSARSGSSHGRSRARSRVTKTHGQKKLQNTANVRRMFKCTFCCDSFRTKYDWVRHESSLHLSTEEWRCAPHGGSVVLPHTGRKHCAYCHLLDPNITHLEEHHHQSCQAGPIESRTFRRKDHLVQHLRLYHRLETLPPFDDWKIEVLQVVSRCGFCDLKMLSWFERADHLAKHFKSGLTMCDWKGDHGFEPLVESQVMNAFPPFLIGEESKVVVPYSATNAAAQDHRDQITSQLMRQSPPGAELEAGGGRTLQVNEATINAKAYTELLSLHLGRFAREKIQQCIVPTDAMFQQEARRVLYDCEDEWNQTVADNEEWLAAFRARTNLGPLNA